MMSTKKFHSLLSAKKKIVSRTPTPNMKPSDCFETIASKKYPPKIFRIKVNKRNTRKSREINSQS